jgi:hypothetical protein
MISFRAILAMLLMALSLGAGAQGFGSFGELEGRLKLKPEQKAQFDIAVKATQRALLSLGMVAIQQKQRIADEIAKPRPDLGALAESHEAILEMIRPHFREAREEWTRLYVLLEPDQIAIARDYVEKQIAMMEKVGEQVMRAMRDKLR